MTRPVGTARRGFTLVEMIASMVIVSLVAGIGSSLVWQGVAACRGTQAGPQAHAELTTAGERIVRELRGIGVRAGTGAPSPDIDLVETDELGFNVNDSLVLRGGSLMLAKDGGAERVLLRGVRALEIRAYGEDGGELGLPLRGSGCDAVRRVTLTITLERDGATDTLRVGTFIRSMMTGVGR